MVEGTAEVFERIYSVQVQGKGAADTADQALFNMQTRELRSRLTLTQLTEAGSTKGRSGYGTARFAAFFWRKVIDLKICWITSLSWGEPRIVTLHLKRSFACRLTNSKQTLNEFAMISPRPKNM
jgi:hypothetical protein